MVIVWGSMDASSSSRANRIFCLRRFRFWRGAFSVATTGVACHRLDIDAVVRLLRSGADDTAKDGIGKTPADWRARGEGDGSGFGG